MRTTLAGSRLDDDRAAHAKSVELALVIEEIVQGNQAAIVLFAACWIIASLMLQAERESHVALDKSLDMITRQIDICVEQLRDIATTSQVH